MSITAGDALSAGMLSVFIHHGQDVSQSDLREVKEFFQRFNISFTEATSEDKLFFILDDIFESEAYKTSSDNRVLAAWFRIGYLVYLLGMKKTIVFNPKNELYEITRYIVIQLKDSIIRLGFPPKLARWTLEKIQNSEGKKRPREINSVFDEWQHRASRFSLKDIKPMSGNVFNFGDNAKLTGSLLGTFSGTISNIVNDVDNSQANSDVKSALANLGAQLEAAGTSLSQRDAAKVSENYNDFSKEVVKQAPRLEVTKAFSKEMLDGIQSAASFVKPVADAINAVLKLIGGIS